MTDYTLRQVLDPRLSRSRNDYLRAAPVPESGIPHPNPGSRTPIWDPVPQSGIPHPHPGSRAPIQDVLPRPIRDVHLDHGCPGSTHLQAAACHSQVKNLG